MPGVGMRGRDEMGQGEDTNVQMYIDRASSAKI